MMHGDTLRGAEVRDQTVIIGLTSRDWSSRQPKDPRPEWAQAHDIDDEPALATAVHVTHTQTTSLTSG